MKLEARAKEHKTKTKTARRGIQDRAVGRENNGGQVQNGTHLLGKDGGGRSHRMARSTIL